MTAEMGVGLSHGQIEFCSQEGGGCWSKKIGIDSVLTKTEKLCVAPVLLLQALSA